MEMLHKRHGSIDWKTLFKLQYFASEGFPFLSAWRNPLKGQNLENWIFLSRQKKYFKRDGSAYLLGKYLNNKLAQTLKVVSGKELNPFTGGNRFGNYEKY